MEKKMTSGEIAKKMGISQKAVRLYDEKGLLKPADYSEGNYRLYDKDSILVLEKIIALKQIGFTLEEIYDNLIAGKNMDIIDSLNEQLEIMEKKKQELERVIGCIKGMLSRTCGQPDWDSVAELAKDIMKDQQADEYHYHALKHTVDKKDWYVRIYEYLNVKANSRILDLGCGFGKLWRNSWSQIPEDVFVCGVDMHGSWADDFDTFIVEHKKDLAKGSDMTIEWGDVETEETWKVISDNESYDYVIAHYLLDFVENVELFVRRAAEKLKKQGIFSCNGYQVNDEHLFWQRIFKDMELKTAFISERISKEEQICMEFEEILSKYFESVELVTFENSMRYEDATEVFEVLCNLYPENKKYLLDNCKKIREYIEGIIIENNEFIVINKSHFLKCYK